MYNSNNSELYLKPALSANTPFRPAAEILYSPVAELVLKKPTVSPKLNKGIGGHPSYAFKDLNQIVYVSTNML